MRRPVDLSDTEQEEANRVTASLAALAFALLLVVLGLYLVSALHNKAAVEDCLMSGRRNCDQLVTFRASPDGRGR